MEAEKNQLKAWLPSLGRPCSNQHSLKSTPHQPSLYPASVALFHTGEECQALPAVPTSVLSTTLLASAWLAEFFTPASHHCPGMLGGKPSVLVPFHRRVNISHTVPTGIRVKRLCSAENSHLAGSLPSRLPEAAGRTSKITDEGRREQGAASWDPEPRAARARSPADLVDWPHHTGLRTSPPSGLPINRFSYHRGFPAVKSKQKPPHWASPKEGVLGPAVTPQSRP